MERTHFTVLVVGENPDERINAFSKLNGVDPYVVYKKSDAARIKKDFVSEYKAYIDEIDMLIAEQNDEKNIANLKTQRDVAIMRLYDLEEQSTEDFFEDLQYDKDLDEDGNIITYYNKNGKFSLVNRGGRFANPFILKDGKETYQATVGDIDWSRIHCSTPAVNTYTRLWEMCVEGSKPENETEENFYENMKNRTDYFASFENKDNFVTSNTALWYYGIIGEDGIYHDPTNDNISQFEWMTKFFNKYIKELSTDKLLTIFECTR